MSLRVGDEIVAERMHDIGAVEEPPDLLWRAAVRDVVILQDLCERPAAMMLTDHVLGDPLLTLRAGRQERERPPDCLDDSH